MKFVMRLAAVLLVAMLAGTLPALAQGEPAIVLTG
jgi:hypothetical protein